MYAAAMGLGLTRLDHRLLTFPGEASRSFYWLKELEGLRHHISVRETSRVLMFNSALLVVSAVSYTSSNSLMSWRV